MIESNLTTNAITYNSSLGGIDFLSTYGSSLGLVLFVGLISVIMAVMISAYFSRSWFKRWSKTFQFLARTFALFLWGIAGLSSVSVMIGVGYFLTMTRVGQGSWKYIGICLAIYVFVCLVGLLTEKFVLRMQQHSKNKKK